MMPIKNKWGERKRTNYQHTAASRANFMFSGLALQQIIEERREFNFLISAVDFRAKI
jgi:hypothetical protein